MNTFFLELRESVKRLGAVIGHAAYRFYWDNGFSRASSLAYTTLFALVPLTALSISMLRVFHRQEKLVGSTLEKIVQQFLPRTESSDLASLQEQVFSYLQGFVGNVAALNTLSIAVFVFTGIALLNTIESALNAVWRVHSDRSLFVKVTAFWAVITLTPLLIAVSVYWTSSAIYIQEFESVFRSEGLVILDFLIPVFVTWFGITILFYKLPATKVGLADAALGAFVSAFLFELLKLGFAYYIRRSATYSALYGVMATIPIFLFWLYLTWVVVLFGAEVSYQWGRITLLSGLRKYATDLGELGSFLGLRVLHCIGKYFHDGKAPPTEREIVLEVGSDPVLIRSCLSILSSANLITTADPDTFAYALTFSPEKLTIKQIGLSFLSKGYRKKLEQGTAEEGPNGTAFLELLRRVSLKIPRSRPVEEWTLEELIEGGLIEDKVLHGRRSS